MLPIKGSANALSGHLVLALETGHFVWHLSYHVNRIKKGSAHTPLGIVDKFDTYETALKKIHY